MDEVKNALIDEGISVDEARKQPMCSFLRKSIVRRGLHATHWGIKL